MLDERNHLGNVAGGAHQDLRPFNLKSFQVLQKSLLEGGRVLGDGDARGGGVLNDAVVHVGDVHGVADRGSGELEEAAEDVNCQESAEVADVAVVVDRGPAGVDAQGLAVHGDEVVDLSGQGVKEAEGHRSLVELPDAREMGCIWAFPIVAREGPGTRDQGLGTGDRVECEKAARQAHESVDLEGGKETD